MTPLAPTYTAHLLVPVHEELVALLRSLDPSQWLLPTGAGAWRVRDVVAHLLDGYLRRLSFHRDGLAQPEMAAMRGYEDVLAYLNRLNATWVTAAERLSPRLLTELAAEVGATAARFLASLPPHAPAHWPVAWAGDGGSENWMDVSRDYTEYWHHQQQIRDAVGAPLLTDPVWLRPVIALGVRAVPPALEPSGAPAGATVQVDATGPAGASWRLRREERGWIPYEAPAGPSVATATVEIDAESLARVWFAGRRPQPAADRARLSGDAALGRAVLAARALMV